MNSSNQHTKYRADIDGLRAMAILPVIFFHAFPGFLPGGFVGVDIFFVISGFLISTIIFRELKQESFSFVEFYSRRVRRLFPALTLVLTATLTFGWFALDADEFKMLGKHVAASAGFIQNFILWDEVGYFDISSELKPLLHLWSLAIEEQFYLLFPLIVWLAWRKGFTVLTLVIVIAAVSLASNLYWVRSDPNGTFYFPYTRVWELMAGAILAAVAFNKQTYLSKTDNVGNALSSEMSGDSSLRKSMLSFAGLGLILLSVIFIDKTDNFPGWRAMIPVLGAVIIIYSGQQAWVNKHILSSKPAVFIGLISYPLYLWHWPLLSFVRIIESEPLSVSLRFTLLVVAVVLATLTYYFAEKPVRAGGSGVQKRWTIALLVIMTFIAATGLLAHQRELTSRLGAGVEEVKEWERLHPSYEDNCGEIFPEWNKTRDTFKCLFLDKGKPKIVVIGDSHARRIHYGISYYVGQEHNTGLFPHGCAMPFYDISVSIPARQRTPDYLYPRAKQINKALDFSINEPAVKVIVLTTSACWNNIVDIKNLEAKNPARIVENKMRETFEKLTQSGKQVIYVLDNPLLNFDPKSCLTRPFRINSSQATCKMKREVYDNQRVQYFRIAKKVLSEFPTIRVFDVATTLCDSEYCHAVVDNKLLYHDTSHLGYEGSKYVGKFLVPTIEKALTESQ